MHVFQRSPFGKRTEIIVCSCVFRSPLVLFLHFPYQQTRVNSSIVFQCSPFDELLENIVSSRVRRKFLVFSGTVSSGEFKKTLVSWRSPLS